MELGGHEKAGQLRNLLETFFTEIAPPVKTSRFRNLIFRNPREKLLAFVLTLGLWYGVVHESRVIHKTFILPVEYAQPTPDLYVDLIDPKEVRVTFSGPRHVFQFLDPTDVRLLIRLYNYGEGTWAISLSEANVTAPKEAVLEEISPGMVMVEIEKM